MRVADIVKSRTPWAIRRLSRRLKRELEWARNRSLPLQAVFETIYAENAWGGEQGSFYSGPGSDGLAADIYVAEVKRFIATHGVRSVVDLGCGDFRVAHKIVHQGLSYVGVDLVQHLVDANTEQFGAGNIRFECRDITEDQLPSGDLCLMREVLQHLSNRQIRRVLAKLGSFRYVIYSDYQPPAWARCVPNRDITPGLYTRIWKNSAVFLDQPPFNIPTRLLFEAPASTVLRSRDERIRSYLIRNPG